MPHRDVAPRADENQLHTRPDHTVNRTFDKSPVHLIHTVDRTYDKSGRPIHGYRTCDNFPGRTRFTR